MMSRLGRFIALLCGPCRDVPASPSLLPDASLAHAAQLMTALARLSEEDGFCLHENVVANIVSRLAAAVF